MADPAVSIVAKLEDQFSRNQDRLIEGFGRLQDRLEGVGSELDSVFTRVSGILGGVTALAAIERSVQLAEEAVEAEQRLVAALDGRKKVTKEILDLTSKLQEETLLEDDALNRQAAVMKRLGVSAELLPRALEAAVNTSAALGQNVDAVVRDIALLSRGEGKGFGGRTLKLIPGIRELIDSGGDLKEIIELLEVRFPNAARDVADTDFGRVTQDIHKLGDAGERIGQVFIKLKLAVFDELVPIVDKLADAVDSQSFRNIIELAKKAVPVVVALSVAVSAMVTALAVVGTAGVFISFLSSLIAVITALAPAIAAVVLFLADAVIAAAPLAAVFAVIAAAAAAVTAVILQATGLMDDFLEGLSGIRGAVSGFTREVVDVAAKVVSGRLEVKDFFDLLSTRADQARILIFGIVSAVASLVTNTLEFVGSRFKIGVLFIAQGVLVAADVIQRGVLNTGRFIVNQVENTINAVGAGLRTLDDKLGTNLGFDDVDLKSIIPDEIIPIRNQIRALSDEIAQTIEQAPESLQRVANEAAGIIGQTFLRVLDQSAALDDRLRESERAILQRRAETDAAELKAQREKTDATLAEVQRLADGVARVAATSGAIAVGQLVDEQEIRRVIQSVGESSRDELSRQIQSDLSLLFSSGAIAAEEFIRLTQAARTASLQERQRRVEEEIAAQKLLEAAAERQLTILSDQIDGHDQLISRLTGVEGREQELIDTLARRAALEDDRTEAAGALLDSTGEILRLERERQSILLETRDVESQINKLRTDSADKAAKSVEKQRADLLKEVESIADLVAAGATAPASALRAVQARIDEFKKSVSEAKDVITALLESSLLGPRLGQALSQSLQSLAKSSDLEVPVRLAIETASIDAAKVQLQLLRQEVATLDVSTTEGFENAVQVVTTGIDAVRRSLEESRRELIRVSDAPGVTTDQLTKIRLQILEIDSALQTLGEGSQIDLARQIEEQVRRAKAAADRELELLGRDIERGLALPSDLVARQQELSEAVKITAEGASQALREIAAASPEVAAAVEEINLRLERLQQDLEPETLGGGDEFFGGIGVGIEDTISRLGNLSDAGQQVGQELVGGLTDGLVNVFIRGRQELSAFAAQFAAEIAIMIAKALLFRAVAGTLGLSPVVPTAAGGMIVPGGWPASSTRSFLAHNRGARRYAGGTPSVPGPRINRDVVPAVLTPGEAVITRSAVDYYGRGFMAALIHRAIPREAALALMSRGAVQLPAALKSRHAAGGVVTGVADRRRPGTQQPIIVSDEQVMDRLINGGEGVLTRFVRDVR